VTGARMQRSTKISPAEVPDTGSAEFGEQRAECKWVERAILSIDHAAKFDVSSYELLSYRLEARL
jgi:hypothetical protein